MAKSKSARVQNKKGNKVQRLRSKRITKFTPGLNFSDWVTYSCSDAVKHTTMAMGSMVLLAGTAYALPQGGTVASGGATISQPDAATTTITQTTDKAVINWRNYNVNYGESVSYVQPGSTSIALNRIANPSVIDGSVSANGQLWFICPNLVIGPNGVISTAGLAISSSDIEDSDFMNGQASYAFASASSSIGAIINKGQIVTTDEGYVVLAAPNVVNQGTIVANLGKVLLASGEAFTLKFDGNSLIDLVIDEEAVNAFGVTNKGGIIANGGQVVLSAKVAGDLVDSVVNNEGLIQARSIGERDGKIFLDGGDSGMVAVSGALDVSGENGGGAVSILGENISVAQGAAINADAGETGDGGQVVVIADDTTQFDGSISARGGALAGDGGFVEISGAHLAVTGHPDLRAPNGTDGTLLFDPGTVNIIAGGGQAGPDTFSDDYLNTQLDLSSVTIATADATGANGADQDIIFVGAPAIAWATSNALTLNSGGDILMAGSLSGTGALNMTFNGALDFSGLSSISAGSITATGNGGNDVFTGPNINEQYNITNAAGNGTLLNSKMTFNSVETLIGGSGDDSFLFNQGVFAMNSIDGGGGYDRLRPVTAVTSWVITGANQGYTDYSSGDISFSNIDRLEGQNSTRHTITCTFASGVTDFNGDLVNSSTTASKIQMTDGDNTFLVTGTKTGTINSGTTFSNWQSIIGGSGTDTISTSQNANLTLDNSSLKSGSTTQVNFSGMDQAELQGGVGNNTISVSGFSGPATIIASNGTDTVTTNGANTTIVGQNTDNTWNLNDNTLTSGANKTTFTGGVGAIVSGAGQDNLIGLNGGDTFTITGANAASLTTAAIDVSGMETLTGGAGDDTFTLASGVVTFNGTIDGGAGTNAIGVTDGVNLWDVAGEGTGILNETTFFSNMSVQNNTSNDILAITRDADFTLTDTKLTLTVGGTPEDFALDSFAQSFAGVRLTGGDSDNTIDVSEWSGSATIFATAGTDSVAGNGANTTLAGPDMANAWSITGANAGTLTNAGGTTTFADVGGLTGGSGADTFTSASGVVSFQGSIAGEEGDDTLAATDGINVWAVTGANAGALNTTTFFSGIENITGGSGADTLAGSAEGDTFTVTAEKTVALTNGNLTATSIDTISGAGLADILAVSRNADLTLTNALLTVSGEAGLNLTGIEAAELEGGADANVINVNAWTGAATISATAGADDITGNGANTTLAGQDAANAWSITGAKAGTLTSGGDTTTFANVGNLAGGADADTLTGPEGGDTYTITAANAAALTAAALNVTGMESLIGGGGDDTFTLASGVTTFSGAIAGGAGANIVGAVDGDNLFVVTGANAGTLNGTTMFTDISTLAGGSGNDTFTASKAVAFNGLMAGGGGTDILEGGESDNAWAVTSANAGFLNGSTAFTGMDLLSGGDGNDTLTGPEGGDSYLITGEKAVTLTGGALSATSIDSLIGGAGDDTFTLDANVPTFNAKIWGLGGINKLLTTEGEYSWKTATLTSGTLNDSTFYYNINSIAGSGADTLAFADDVDMVLAYSAEEGGSLAAGEETLYFTGFTGANLTGGASANVIDVSGWSGEGFTATITLTGGGDTVIGNGAGTTLIGQDLDSAWTISDANNGSVTNAGGTVTFTGVGAIQAGAATDTMNGLATGDLYTITAANAVEMTAAAINATSIEALVGGAGNDIFMLVSGVDTFNGTINGGEGLNTLRSTDTVNAWVLSAETQGTLNLTTQFSGITTLAGGSDEDTLTVTRATGDVNLTLTDTKLTITGEKAVTLSGFEAAELSGGAGANAINVSGWTGDRTAVVFASAGADTVTGNGANTTLAGENIASAWSISGEQAGAVENIGGTTTFTAVGTIVGGILGDTLTGLADGDTYSITGANAVAMAGADINAEGIETLMGGAGNDSFIMADGVETFNGTIDGDGGVNTLSALTGANLWAFDSPTSGTFNTTTAFNNINFAIASGEGIFSFTRDADMILTDTSLTIDGEETLNLTGFAEAILTGGISDNIIDASEWTGATTVNATAGDDTLIGNGGGITLVGPDMANAWNLTAKNAGTLVNAGGTTTFTGVVAIEGGADTDTLTGMDADETFTITDANAVTLTAADISATSIESLIGGGLGTNTLKAGNNDNDWILTAAKTGTVNGMEFSNMTSLGGGTGTDTLWGFETDTYTLTATGSFTLTNAGMSASSIDSIVGAGTTNSLAATTGSSLSWNITGANEGSVGSTTFTGFNALSGGTGADTFTIAADVVFDGSIDGGASGTDVLNAGNGDNAWIMTAANTGTVNGIAFSNIDSLAGGSGQDAITGLDTGETFEMTTSGGALTLSKSGVSITSVETMIGGAGDDQFLFGWTGHNIGPGGVIIGGGGDDTLRRTVTGTANQTWTITGENSGVMAPGSGNDTTFSGIEIIYGHPGTDTFTFNAGATTFNGRIDGNYTAAGGDYGLNTNDVLVLNNGVDNDMVATGANDFTLNDTTFFTKMFSITGGSGTDTLTGLAAGDTYTISNPNAVALTTAAITATGIESLVGGAGNDTFTLASGVTTFNGAIDGGEGMNTLAATNGANTWNVTDPNAGTLNGSTVFSGISAFTGGSGTDTLNTAVDAASIILTDALLTADDGSMSLSSIDVVTLAGGAGNNAIVVSDWSGAVTITATDGTDTITGNGADTTLAGQNTANAWTLTSANNGTLVSAGGTTTFAGVTGLTGGSDIDTLTGYSDAAVTYKITGQRAVALTTLVEEVETTLVSASAMDTLIGSTGNDAITLAAGVSTFNGAIIGGGGTDTLAATDGANAWAVTDAKTGTLNGSTSFSGIAVLAGGTGTDTLTGLAAGDTYTVTDAKAITLTTGDMSATSIDVLNGGAGTDILVGLADGDTYTVTGVNAVTLSTGGFSATSIDSLAGGAGADTIEVTRDADLNVDDTSFAYGVLTVGGTDELKFTGIESAALKGGAGDNFISSQQWSGTATIYATAGDDTVDGNGAGTTLVGQDATNTWDLSGEQEGLLTGAEGTTGFLWVGNIVGGSGDDTFTLAGGEGTFNGSIAGSGGTDILAMTDGTNAWVVNAANAGTLNASTIFSGMEILTGGSGVDSLTGPDGGETFTVTEANAVTLTVGALSASSIENLSGGAGNDTLAVTRDADITLTNALLTVGAETPLNLAGIEAAELAGGANANTIDVTAWSGKATVFASDGIDTVNGNGANTSLAGDDVDNAWTIDVAKAGTLTSAGGTTTFTEVGGIIGGAAVDTLNGLAAGDAYTITGANAVTIAGAAMNATGIDSLIGGDGNDTFKLGSNVASFEGAIYGGDGTNSLQTTDDLAGDNIWVWTTLNSGTLNGTTDFFEINVMDGGTGTDTITIVQDANMILTDTLLTVGADTLTLIGVTDANLTGGVSDNTINAGAWTGTLTVNATEGNDTITGNGANTTLIGQDAVNIWSLTAANKGSLSSGGFTTTFTKVGAIVGGAETDTLSGLATGDIYTVTGANAVSLANAKMTASGIETVNGGAGADTLIGLADGDTYTVTAAKTIALTNGGFTATSIDTLTGGAGADTISVSRNTNITLTGTTLTVGTEAALTLGGIEAAEIEGGASANAINVGTWGGTATVHATDGSDTVIGNGANTTIVGQDVANAWAVSAAKNGTLTSAGGTTILTSVGKLVGGTDTDTLTGMAAGDTYTIDGENSVALTAGQVSATSIDALIGGDGNDTFTLTSGISSFGGTIDGGKGANSLAATDGDNIWNVTGANAGTLNDTTGFSNIGVLTGGSGADAMNVSVDADITLENALLTVGTSGMVFGGVESVTVEGGASANIIDVSAWTGDITIFATGGADDITGNGANTVLMGQDIASAWGIDGANSGTLTSGNDTASFSAVGSIIGGAENDTFTLAEGITTFSGTIDGGAGTNALEATDGTNAWVVTGEMTGTLNTSTLFSNIGVLNGGTGSDALTGLATGGTYTVTGANAATLKADIEEVETTLVSATAMDTLIGGAGDDAFVLNTGVTTFNGTIVAGAGANTLSATNGTNAWSLTGTNAGVVNETTFFSGIGALNGGSSTDTFTLAEGITTFSGAIDGGAGTNTLAATDGENLWAVTDEKSGTLNETTVFANISRMSGGAGEDTLNGLDTDSAYTITGENAVTLTTSSMSADGIEILNGGAGSDTFTLGSGVLSFNGTIDGMGGSDILAATNGTNVWVVTGAGAGTLNETTVFENIDGLAGGSVTDAIAISADDDITLGDALLAFGGGGTFTLAGIESATVEGGAGANMIDVSDFSGTATLTVTGGADTLIGNGANTILIAKDTANDWVITGAKAGTLTSADGKTTFTNVVNLVGGADVDTLTTWVLNETLTITAENTVELTEGGVNASSIESLIGGSVNATFVLDSGVTTFNGDIVGGAGTNILQATDGDNVWTLTDLNSGSLNGTTTFTAITALAGGEGTDTVSVTMDDDITLTDALFMIGGDAGVMLSGMELAEVSGGASDNTINVLGWTGSVTVFATDGADVVNGSGAGTTLVGQDVANAWNVTGAGSGTLTSEGGTTTFISVGNLAGGEDADTLTGPAGDTYTITGENAVSLTAGAVNASSIDILNGNEGDETFILGEGVATFNGTIDGGDGTNTMAAIDGDNLFVVTGANEGTLNQTTSFTNIAEMAGGSGDDTFTMSTGIATFNGAIDGGEGTDTLTATDGDNDWAVTSANAGSLNTSTTFSGIEQIAGGSGVDTLTGATAGQTFMITGANAAMVNGVDAFMMDSLIGGGGDDTFTMAEGVLTFNGAIEGGGGSDTLGTTDISAGINVWSVTDVGIGTLNTTTTFSGITTLAGGSEADTLIIARDADITVTDSVMEIDSVSQIALNGMELAQITGGAGDNAIDVSGFTSGTAAIEATAGNDTVTGNGANTTLIGQDAENAWVVTGKQAGTLTSADGKTTFTAVSSLAGGSDIDTLTGLAAGDDYLITGPNAATLTTGAVNVVNMESLIGGEGNDTFTLDSNVATFNGFIDGGAGSNTLGTTDTLAGDNVWNWISTETGTGTLNVTTEFTGINVFAASGDDTFSITRDADFTLTDTLLTVGEEQIGMSGFGAVVLTGGDSDNSINVSLWTKTATIHATAGNDTLTGNGANTTLVGADGTNAWSLTAANAGTLTTSDGNDTSITTFTKVGVLAGGSGEDTLTGLDADTYLLTGANTATLTTGAVAVTSFETLIGGSGADTFTLDSNVATFNGVIDGGSGGVDTLATTDNLAGDNIWVWASSAGDGTLNATTVFSGMNIMAPSGSDILSITRDADFAMTDTALTAGEEQFSLAGFTSVWLTGGDSANVIDVSESNMAATIFFSNGDDTITGNGANTILTGLDATNAWSIDGENAGTLNTTTAFAGIATLLGGSDADTFTLAAGVSSFDGAIDGGGGTKDALKATDGDNAWVVTDKNAGTLNATTTFSNIASLVGGSGQDSLTGLDSGDTYTLAAANTATLTNGGVAVSSMDTLIGGAGDDTFSVGYQASSWNGTIMGGDGADTVQGMAFSFGGNIVWTITGENAVTMGTNVFFSGVETVKGGQMAFGTWKFASNDDFTFASGVTTFNGTLDGNGGTDSLATTDGDNVWTLTGPGAVTLNTTTTIFNMPALSGGSGTDTLTGLADGDTYTITGENAVTVTTGAVKVSGFESLIGGAGDDTFTLGSGATSFNGAIDAGEGVNTLSATDGTNAFVITALNAATLNETTAVSGISALTGGSGDDTFALAQGVTAFSGAIDGGAGTDAIQVEANADFILTDGLLTFGAAELAFSGIESALLKGGVSDNAFDLSGWTGTATIFATNGADTILGNGAGTTLAGPDVANAWVLTGANAGTLAIEGSAAATTFTGVGALVGGADIDTLTGLDADTYLITGENAATLTTAAITVAGMESIIGGAGDDTFTLDEGVWSFNGAIDAGEGTDTLATTDGANLWVSTSEGSGTLNETTVVSGFDVMAPSGNDILSVARNDNFTLTETLLTVGSEAFDMDGFAGVILTGGASANTINVSDWGGTATINATAGSDTVTGNGADTTLVGQDLANVWTLTEANNGTLTNEDGTTTFTGVGVLVGGSDMDTLNGLASDAYLITDANAATLTTAAVTVSGMETLIGGEGDDAFTLDAGVLTFNGVIDGGEGTNSLAATDGENVWVWGEAGSGTLNETTIFSNIGDITASGNDTFCLTRDADFTLTDTLLTVDEDEFSMVGFTSVQLTGGASDNIIHVGEWSGTATIVASAGNDTVTGTAVAADTTLVGMDGENVWTLTAANAGTLVSGNDTTTFSNVGTFVGGASKDSFIGLDSDTYLITAANAFTATTGAVSASSFEVLRGGSGDDTFTLAADVSSFNGQIVGSGGTNTLAATNGENAWAIIGSGLGTLNTTTTFTMMDVLAGGTGSDTLTGLAAGDAYEITGPNAVTLTGAGLSATSINTLVGGNGDDTFKLAGGLLTFSGAIDGGAGENVLATTDGDNTWVMTGQDAGALNNSTIFSGIGLLAGGEGTDTISATADGNFTLIDDLLTVVTLELIEEVETEVTQTVAFTGFEAAALTGGASDNAFDVSEWTGTATITATDGEDTVTGNGDTTLKGQNTTNAWTLTKASEGTLVSSGGTTTFTGVTGFTGGSGQDTLNGLSSGDYYTVTGANAASLMYGKVSATSIDTLVGGTGGDFFTIDSNVTTFNGVIDGGGWDSLTATDGENAWSITDLASGSGTFNTTTTFSGMTGGLNGGSGNDTLSFTSDAAAIMLLPNSLATGTVVEGAFNAEQSILLGYTEEAGGYGTTKVSTFENAMLTGGDSDNAIMLMDPSDYTSWSGTATINATNGNDTINCGMSNVTLVGQNTANTWTMGKSEVMPGFFLKQVTLTFSGGTTIATGPAKITGGTEADTLVTMEDGDTVTITGSGAVTVANQSIAGGFFNATVYATSIESLAGGDGDDTFTLAEGVSTFSGRIIGGGGANTLATTDGDNTWILAAENAGTLNGSTNFSEMTTLAGGAGNDAFSIGSALATFNGAITGGAGEDSITIAREADMILTDADVTVGGELLLTWSGIDRADLGGGPDSTTIDVSDWAGAATIYASGGNDTVVGNGVNTTLTSQYSANAWSISAANDGSLALDGGTTTFTGVAALLGGSYNDAFTLAAGVPTFNGAIDGGSGGTDTLAVTDGGNVWSLNEDGTITLNTTTLISNIDDWTSGGNDTLSITRDADFTLTDAKLTAGAEEFDMTGFVAAQLIGGASDNLIDVSDWTSAVTVVASGGNDTVTGNGTSTTLIGSDAANAWSLTAANAGTLASGNDTTTFSGVNSLIGGADSDSFTLAADVVSFSGAIAGGAGENSLTATNGANTWTISGADAGTLNTTTIFSEIGNLTGGSGDDTFTGAEGGSISGALTDAAGTTTLSNISAASIDIGGSATLNGSIISAGALNLAGAATLNGNVTADSFNVGGSATLNGNITAGSFNAAGATVLAGNTAINTSAANGDITFGGTLNGNKTLALTAGSGDIAFNGAVGGTTALGAVTVNAANDVTIGSTFASAGFNQAVAGAGTTTVSGQMTSTGAVNLAAATVEVNGGINAGANSVTLDSTEAINQTGGAIIAGTLNVDSDGAVSLTRAANDVGTLNVTAGGNIQYTDATDLLLGIVDAGTGNVTLTAGGTINGGTITGTTVSLAGTTIGLTTPPTLTASTTTLNVTATAEEDGISAMFDGPETLPTINATTAGAVYWNDADINPPEPVIDEEFASVVKTAVDLIGMTEQAVQEIVIKADSQGFFTLAGSPFTIEWEEEETDIGFSEDGMMILKKKRSKRK